MNSPQSLKILLVDDSRTDRETCRRYLTRHPLAADYRFIEHDSLTGAMELVLAERPDCILMDCHLHDGTGLDFLRDLHRGGGTADIPVVMLTGADSEAIAVEAMKNGAQDYLGKGRLTADILHRAVEGAIYKVRAARLLEVQGREMERLLLGVRQANERKDHFLATLSHELRTPLTPVLAAVALLEEAGTLGPEDLRGIAAIIRRNVELEARLIDDLLDLTRIAGGTLSVELAAVDLREVIRSAVEVCRQEIDTFKIRIVEDFQALNPLVDGDAARLQQVFWNLLRNAARFTPEGGMVTLSIHEGGHGWLEARVTDTGIGIAPAQLENIFQAFDQGEATAAGRRGGLGLGLAICRALVEAQGGSIGARNNQDGPGAEFLIRLRASKPAVPIPAILRSKPENSPSLFHARTVLVVEDHADSAFFLSRIIRRMGHEVVNASCVAEALEVFRGRPVDCVVSDIGLPDGNGTDLLPRLLAIRQVPAIALSGYGMEEDVRKCREAGFRMHLTKPVTSARLTAAVELLLQSP